MEELRAGKSPMSTTRRRPALSAGKAYFDFPPRRVLISGGANGIGETIAASYLRAGCKVAVFDIDNEKGQMMANRDGIRFYHTDVSDSNELEKAFSNLLNAWRDVDIIVNNAPSLDYRTHLANMWRKHKLRYSIPSDYGGRFIDININSNIPEETLYEFGITTNCIVGISEKGSFAELCLLLSLPISKFITGNEISVKI